MTDLASVSAGASRAALMRGRAAALFKLSPTLSIGLAILGLLGVVAILAPWITPFNPTLSMPDKILQPPGAEHYFGTDGYGMDVFSRVVAGTRWAFGTALPAAAIGLLVGVPVGLYAGYRGGWWDEIIMRAFDALRVFPTIILTMAIVAAAGPSFINIVLVIGLVDSPMYARVVRAEVISLRSSTFVEAAVAIGNPPWRVMFLHILPNVLKGAFAQTAVRAAWAVRISATLAFLGIGIQPPTPEWGAMIRQGTEQFMTGQWWVGLFPGLALIVMVLALNMVGDGALEMTSRRKS